MSPEVIIAMTAAHYGRTVEQLLSRERHQPLAEQRQVAMYLCRQITGLSYLRIGPAFSRDHSTIRHAVELI